MDREYEIAVEEIIENYSAVLKPTLRMFFKAYKKDENGEWKLKE